MVNEFVQTQLKAKKAVILDGTKRVKDLVQEWAGKPAAFWTALTKPGTVPLVPVDAPRWLLNFVLLHEVSPTQSPKTKTAPSSRSLML
jgi:hypothetical protein